MRPASFDALGWEPPGQPALVGPLAPNRDLESATLIAEGLLDQPEDVAVDLADAARPLYTGVPDGRLLRVDWQVGRAAKITTIATPGGLPLGLKMTPDGHLLVADSGRLLSVATREHGYPLSVLTSACAGVPFHFLNDLDVAKDGTVYFSQTSDRRYSAAGYQAIYANLEAKPEGSLFAYEPSTKRTRRLMDGLHFANGVAVMDDQASVLVVETSHFLIRRYWLKGPQAGTNDVFADNLAGQPDGIMGDGKGRYWVAMNAKRSAIQDFAAPRPWLTNLFSLLPGPLLLQIGVGESYGLLVAYNAQGQVVRSLHDETGRFVGGIANAEPYGNKLYLGTKWGQHLAIVDLPD
jgi:sugar lactone lactonase YvrE